MLLAGLRPNDERFARIERWTAAIVLPIVLLVQLDLLWQLLVNMVKASSEVTGLALLTTSIAIWATNVLLFSLAYWHLDRNGPWGRQTGWDGPADFTFPHGDPEDHFPQGWRPTYPDYLDLAFNTSTAFSPTDVLPLSPRAKMLMMLQSTISLVTVITVGARAINILGS